LTILLFTSTNEVALTAVERQIHLLDGLTEEDRFGGIEVEYIPEHENNGKLPQLHINKETKEMWYEYTDIPKTEIEILKEENEVFRQSQTEQDELIMGLMLGGM
jgi:hypothetical protein